MKNDENHKFEEMVKFLVKERNVIQYDMEVETLHISCGNVAAHNNLAQNVREASIGLAFTIENLTRNQEND